MGVAGEATEHPSDLTKVPVGSLKGEWYGCSVSVLSLRKNVLRWFIMQSLVKSRSGAISLLKAIRMSNQFEGTRATPEFLQAIAYEVYVKNVTFGLLHQWLTDMGMTISKNTLRATGLRKVRHTWTNWFVY